MSRLITPSPRRFIPSLGIIRGALRDLEREAMPLLPSLSLALPARPAPLSAPFTPASLGNDLYEWWDAENATSVPQTPGAVTTWTSLGSGLAPTQATGSKRPIWSATAFNSRPGITFDGSDDGLSIDAVGNLPTGANPCWVWWLGSQDAAAADATTRYATTYGNTSSTSVRALRRASTGVINEPSALVNATARTLTTPEFFGKNLLLLKVSGTQIFLDVNGIVDTGQALVPTTLTLRTTIATSANTSGNFFQGVMNSIIVTNVLSAQNEANMYTYLNARSA